MSCQKEILLFSAVLPSRPARCSVQDKHGLRPIYRCPIRASAPNSSFNSRARASTGLASFNFPTRQFPQALPWPGELRRGPATALLPSGFRSDNQAGDNQHGFCLIRPSDLLLHVDVGAVLSVIITAPCAYQVHEPCRCGDFGLLCRRGTPVVSLDSL